MGFIVIAAIVGILIWASKAEDKQIKDNIERQREIEIHSKITKAQINEAN